MSGFNLPPGVSALYIPGNDFDDESQHQATALRDYFAAKAMAVIMDWDGNDDVDSVAALAYMQADAMLKAREVQA
jgi:hypothetical protein